MSALSRLERAGGGGAVVGQLEHGASGGRAVDGRQRLARVATAGRQQRLAAVDPQFTAHVGPAEGELRDDLGDVTRLATARLEKLAPRRQDAEQVLARPRRAS